MGYDGVGYDGGALAAAAPASSGAAGAGDPDPWGAYMGSPALDEDAQREWRAFVEKSKAAAVRFPARSSTLWRLQLKKLNYCMSILLSRVLLLL